MQFDFKAVMAKKTNDELFAVLAEPEKYQPDAIIAAKNEMVARNLSESELAISKNIYESEKSAKEAKASEGLELRDYIILLLPLVGIFIVAGMYKGNGYDNKAKQAIKIGMYYFAIIILLVILINLFS